MAARLDKSRTILTTTAVMMMLTAPAWAEDLKLTPNQVRAIGFVNAARIAGSGDRCPRFHLIEAATFSELAAAGVTNEMSHSPEFSRVFQATSTASLAKYSANPSEFCATAWKTFGPDGSFKRQMLEQN
jgi:hypothetical protein